LIQRGQALMRDNPQLARAAESLSLPQKIKDKHAQLAEALMTELKSQAVDKGEAKRLIALLLRLGFVEQVHKKKKKKKKIKYNITYICIT
jgi:hypothetical protein